MLRKAPAFPRLIPVLLLAASFAAILGARPRPLPPIVFVSRLPLAGSTLVPGVGPAGRFAAPGGRLFVRESDGTMRELAPGRFHDVSDPAVSYDGRYIAFAAVAHRDSAWRIWRIRREGTQLAAVTRSDRDVDLRARFGAAGEAFERYDDIDPCWLPDGRLVFASTRWPWRAEQGSALTTNLWVVNADGTELKRISSERNGAEEPSIDPRTGRIVYARWFFSRYAASDSGVTTDRALAMPADTVDLWHALSAQPDGDLARLQGGDPLSRAGQMAYQPVVLMDSTLYGVRPERSSILRATRFGIQRWRHGFSAAEPLFGYGASKGWSAISPCPLPDGRLLFSYDEEGTGNFKLMLWDERARKLEPFVDELGRLEMDPAVLAERPLPPPPLYIPNHEVPAALPYASREALEPSERGARFDCLNVFANGPVDSRFPDAPLLAQGLRIRFFTALPRPDLEGGDSLVLLHEAPVFPDGAIHVDAVPSDVPTFEQLIDMNGRVIRSASGPAHVPGFNFTRPGTGTKCVGCHAGHSALPVAESKRLASYTNLAPSARVTASSIHPATGGPQGAVDRRTVGEVTRVAWLADAAEGQWLRLDWELPIETGTVVLYAVRASKTDGGELRVPRSELVLFLHGQEVRRVPVLRGWTPGGLRVEFPPTRIDALEVRPLQVAGRFRGRAVAALAEIETIARIDWE